MVSNRKTDPSKVEQVIKLNLQVPYELTRLSVAGMKINKWGRIINIGSISGIVGEAKRFSLFSK